MEKKQTHPILKLIFIGLLIIFITLLYSRFISTSGLKVKEYKIVNENIPDNINGLKIIHLSDIHYGRIIDHKRLEKIVDKVNLIKPDIVVITGDLIDRDTKLTDDDINYITNSLSKINASIGKYAIRGNHDYVFDKWADIIVNSEFINLDNSYDYLYANNYEPILISGLSSLQDEQDVNSRYDTIKSAIEKDNKSTIYNILLVHETDFVDNIDISKYNLILGGHSHNGQVRLPFIGPIILPPESKKYYDEYYDLGTTDFYISSGLGTSELDFRFFNRPSFNFYRITNK